MPLTEDRALLDAAKHLVIEEHLATATLLRALMEIDTRRLYLGEGCASMFSYCTQVLHLAEGAAYNRIEAARAARSYPLILELFEQGAITLTAVRLLAPHLTAENHVAVLTIGDAQVEARDRGARVRIEAEAGCAGRRAKAPDASSRAGPAIGVGSERTVCEPSRRDTACCWRMPTRALFRCQSHRHPQSRRSPPNAIGFSSPSRARHTTSSGVPRRCCVTRCPRGMPPKSSIAP